MSNTAPTQVTVTLTGDPNKVAAGQHVTENMSNTAAGHWAAANDTKKRAALDAWQNKLDPDSFLRRVWKNRWAPAVVLGVVGYTIGGGFSSDKPAGPTPEQQLKQQYEAALAKQYQDYQGNLAQIKHDNSPYNTLHDVVIFHDSSVAVSFPAAYLAQKTPAQIQESLKVAAQARQLNPAIVGKFLAYAANQQITGRTIAIHDPALLQSPETIKALTAAMGIIKRDLPKHTDATLTYGFKLVVDPATQKRALNVYADPGADGIDWQKVGATPLP